eukprot:Hpha_TRINITY_DN15568_c1_g2::TRINITY_DN15568_c1_g2_i3::g.109176::m.109176
MGSDSLYVSAVAENTGRHASNFFCSVVECSDGVKAGAVDEARVAPSSNFTFSFYLSARVDREARDAKCSVQLRGEGGRLLDDAGYEFTVPALRPDKGLQDGFAPGAKQDFVEDGDIVTDDESGGCTACPWYNPICFVTRKCFLQLVIRVGVIVGLVVVGCVLLKTGVLKACCKCMCRACKSVDDDSDSDVETPPRKRRGRKRRRRVRRDEAESSDSNGTQMQERSRRNGRRKRRIESESVSVSSDSHTTDEAAAQGKSRNRKSRRLDETAFSLSSSTGEPDAPGGSRGGRKRKARGDPEAPRRSKRGRRSRDSSDTEHSDNETPRHSRHRRKRSSDSH